jgi:hypothetical protein
MRGRLALATGWTFDYIDGLEWNEGSAMMDFFLDEPPVHMLVAAFMGYRNKRKPTEFEEKAKAGALKKQGIGAGKSFKDAPAHIRMFIEQARLMGKELEDGTATADGEDRV